jgi:hypothetical protein
MVSNSLRSRTGKPDHRPYLIQILFGTANGSAGSGHSIFSQFLRRLSEKDMVYLNSAFSQIRLAGHHPQRGHVRRCPAHKVGLKNRFPMKSSMNCDKSTKALRAALIKVAHAKKFPSDLESNGKMRKNKNNAALTDFELKHSKSIYKKAIWR